MADEMRKLINAIFADDGTVRTHVTDTLFIQTRPETFTANNGELILRNPDDEIGYEWWCAVKVKEIPALIEKLQDIYEKVYGEKAGG